MLRRGEVPPGHDASPLLQSLRVVRERWWILTVIVLVSVAVALAVSITTPVRYEATSTLLFRPDDLSAVIEPAAQAEGDPERQLGTNLLLVSSPEVAKRVAARLGPGVSPDGLAERITVESQPEANLITITASAPSPQKASRLATVYAQEFEAFRRETERARFAEGRRLLLDELEALSPAAEAQRAQLGEALQKVNALRAVTTGDVEAVGSAELPSGPAAPQPVRNLLLALVLGTGAGLALVFLVDLFDRRVKTAEDLEELYATPALVRIPQLGGAALNRQALQSSFPESYGILRSALALMAPVDQMRVVLVTSAVAGEGKTTVAVGLAHALALSGEQVTLVEADLRHPTFDAHFDLGDDRRGLTSALVEGVPVGRLLRAPHAETPSLEVLPSGLQTQGASKLTHSDKLTEVLEALRDNADVVVIDAPPLLPVADAQILLGHPVVDACLIVARANLTTRDQARRTQALLERYRIRRLGLVVNGVRHSESEYQNYPSDGVAPSPPAERALV